MKFFVMALVVVVGYYVYQDWKTKKEAREIEEQAKNNNQLVVVDADLPV